MKKIVLFLIISLPFYACNSDDDSGVNTEEVNYSMSFKVDAITYDDILPETTVNTKTEIYGYQGMMDSFTSVTVYLPLNATEGTHPITSENTAESYNANYTFAGGGINADATTGTITVTHITDTYLEGTFSFSVQGTGGVIEVKDGYFITENIQ